MALQQFKENDLVEKKFTDAGTPTLALLGADRDTFYENAYEVQPLGGVLFDLNRSPLASAVTRQTFVEGFAAIHGLFKRPSTFEFYLDVFRAIFGEAVEVTFTIPAPGKLEIAIAALSIQLFDFAARRIVDDSYTIDEVVDHDGDNLAFPFGVGDKTQSEIDALMYEIQASGIFTTATLVLT